MPLHPGDILNNTYRVLGEVAQGGFATVYKAESFDPSIDSTVYALKALHEGSLNETAAELFRREARRLIQLNVEAVVRCYGIQQSPDGQLILVMDYVEGPSLQQRVKPSPLETSPLSQADIVALCRRLLPAMDALHALGVVHRDLAPDNIILRDDEVAKATLIDFGISKDLADDDAATVIGDRFAGKLRYAAPEQMGLFGGARTIGPKTDLYSLCVVILFAATGRPLFEGSGFTDAVTARQAAPDLSFVPDWLRPMLIAGLTPDPAHRAGSGSQLLALLDPSLANVAAEPAPPPPAGARTWLTAEITSIDDDAPATPASPGMAPDLEVKGGRKAPVATGLVLILVLLGLGWAVARYAQGHLGQQTASSLMAQTDSAAGEPTTTATPPPAAPSADLEPQTLIGTTAGARLGWDLGVVGDEAYVLSVPMDPALAGLARVDAVRLGNADGISRLGILVGDSWPALDVSGDRVRLGTVVEGDKLLLISPKGGPARTETPSDGTPTEGTPAEDTSAEDTSAEGSATRTLQVRLLDPAVPSTVVDLVEVRHGNGPVAAVADQALLASAAEGGPVLLTPLTGTFPSQVEAPPVGVARFAASLLLTETALFVGSPGDDNTPGRVDIYQRSNPWAVTLAPAVTLSAPQSRPGDGFGATLALDGEHLLVAAPGARQVHSLAPAQRGAPLADWTVQQSLQAQPLDGPVAFGVSLGMDETTLLVGAPGQPGEAEARPGAYLYQRAGADMPWQLSSIFRNPQAPTGQGTEPSFGRRVAVIPSALLVAAPGDNREDEEAGAVHLYPRDTAP